MSALNIPHNDWVFLAEHKGGGKYLYIGKSKLKMQEIIDRQNPDTLISISKPDVCMVIIYD